MITITSPLEHFELNFFTSIYLYFINLSLTNLSIYLSLISFFLIFIFGSLQNFSVIPSKSQFIFESLYNFILDLLKQQIKAPRALRLFPILLYLFFVIFFLNFSSLVSSNVAITGHLLITMSIAFSVFIALIIAGFLNYRLNFFDLVMPGNVPKALFPMFVVIETLSFLIRPFSLSIRLFANMLAGHTLMSIFAAFGLFVLNSCVLFFYFPLLFIFFIVLLEIGVAAIQAYVFVVLLIIYFNDIYLIAH